MSKKTSFIIIIAILVVIGLSLVGTYNSFVSSEQKVEAEEANVAVMLQRRADLIPNLVATVKGYTSHETAVIEAVVDARTKLVNANGIKEQGKANDELTSALKGLFVIVENYPDLKASANFIQLQDELAGTENRIATSRRDYNEAVNIFNTKIRKFPNNIIAGMFGFEKKDLFEANENANTVPNVDFD